MKSKSQSGLLNFAAILATAFIPAQAGSADLETPPSQSPNRFGLSYRFSFNITADFKNVGAFTPQGHIVPGNGLQPSNPGPATGGGINRTYDDGYNWLDSSGNLLGLTRFWGYDYGDNNATPNHPSQLQGDSIVMHSTSSSGISSRDRDDDPAPGFEITYNRELFRHEKWRWGVEAAIGYTTLDIRDRRALTGTASQIADAFALPAVPGGGVVTPPPAPYDGSFELRPEGNPVISDSPSRTISNVAESISGRRDFDVDLFGLRLGPYIEWPVSKRVTLGLSGGFALVYANSDFRYNQNVLLPTALISQASRGSHDDLLPGGFVAGNCSYSFSQFWSAFASVQFQDVGEYTHRQSGQKAVLDLSKSIFVSLGISRSF